MMAPIRVTEKDNQGNLLAKYVEGSAADHFAHASNYAFVAESSSNNGPLLLWGES
jgi:hypothetical protein